MSETIKNELLALVTRVEKETIESVIIFHVDPSDRIQWLHATKNIDGLHRWGLLRLLLASEIGSAYDGIKAQQLAQADTIQESGQPTQGVEDAGIDQADEPDRP